VASGRVHWLQQQVEFWNAGDIDRFFDAIGPDFEFTREPALRKPRKSLADWPVIACML
jgi:hypothetical protein